MDFTEKFKTYTNTELLRIIDNPNDYQPKAVETAKILLSSRELTEAEIKIARDELEGQGKSTKEQRKGDVEEEYKNTVKSILNNVNPIPEKVPTAKKSIKIISILFGGLFILQHYHEFGMLSFRFTPSSPEQSLYLLLNYLLLGPVAAGIILFYMRKKIGWLLFTMYLTNSATSAI
jgi:hypothetical protein